MDRETLDDKSGFANEWGYAALESVHLVATSSETRVSWERQSRYSVGDPVRTPWLASRAAQSEPFSFTELPNQGYACKTPGYAFPSETSFTFWGLNGDAAFSVWKAAPKVVRPAGTLASASDHRVGTGSATVSSYAASRGVALSAEYTEQCAEMCGTCDGKAGRVALYDLTRSGSKATRLAALPNSERVLRAAPALSMHGAGGIAAYRDADGLSLVWLDAQGSPLGPPLRFATGDVGAPAVAHAGARAVVAWVHRARPGDPYVLSWAAPLHGAAAPLAVQTVARPKAAYAPSVAFDGKRAALAWMEGTDGSQGQIVAAQIDVDAPHAPAEVVSVSEASEANARDPEISAAPQRLTIAYASFAKARPGGVVRLAQLNCGQLQSP